MRISNDMRDALISKTVKTVLLKKQKMLEKESSDLAELVYGQLYPGDIRANMDKLPSEFFVQKSIIYVQTGKSEYSKDLIELKLKSSKKVSALDNDYRKPCWKIKDIENAITKRILALQTKRLKLNKEHDKLRDNLSTMLAGIKTLKQLREEWPEGAIYYADLEPIPVIKNLPAVRGKDVSLMISEIEAGSL